MGSADQRRSQVLSAIVSDFVSTGEPVGSLALVARHQLGVSPATIRNDMSVLEAQGYLYQPHTSSGRVPTEKGYRCFVDQITSLRPLRPQQKRALETFLVEASSVDDVIERAVKLLAQLTHQLAVVQYPRTLSYGLRHLELVCVGENELLVVAITDAGKVSQRILSTPLTLTEGEVRLLREILGKHLAASSRDQVQASLTGVLPALALAFPLPSREFTQLTQLVQEIGRVVTEALTERGERIVMAGAGNLVRAETEFSNPIGEILDVLEEQVALLQLFNEAQAEDGAVHVAIGSETGQEELGEAAVITSSYAPAESARAHLGVIGPRRMDYVSAMSTVKAVSRYLSAYLQSG